jgi:hypothetical protein
LGQGVAAVQGLVNPQAAHAEQTGLNISTPVVEGPEAVAGGIVGGTLPVAGVSLIPGAGIPLSAALMGAQAAGQARADIAGQREQGQNITPRQELKYAAEHGGVNVGLVRPSKVSRPEADAWRALIQQAGLLQQRESFNAQ